MRACHPASALAATGPLVEVSTPRSPAFTGSGESLVARAYDWQVTRGRDSDKLRHIRAFQILTGGIRS